MTSSDCAAITVGRLARADLALIDARETIVYLLAAIRHTHLADEAHDTIRDVLPSRKA